MNTTTHIFRQTADAQPRQYENRLEQIKAVNEKFGPVYIHDMKAVLK